MEKNTSFPNLKIITSTAAETLDCGTRLARMLKAGDVVDLRGPLGAGKTTLVKGIVVGLGFRKNRVTSPTFTLIHEYASKPPVAHIDLYRLERLSSDDAEAIRECMDSRRITIIEWGEKFPELLPQKCHRIDIAHLRSGGREITARLAS